MKFIFKWVNTYVHSYNRYVHKYIQIKVERLKTSLLERLLEYPPPHTLSWTLNNFKDSNYCFLKVFLMPDIHVSVVIYLVLKMYTICTSVIFCFRGWMISDQLFIPIHTLSVYPPEHKHPNPFREFPCIFS